MKTNARFAPATLLLAAIAASASANTGQFLDDAVVDFASGDYTTSTLTQDGFVLPPIQRERLSRIDAEVGWDVVERGDTRFVATGHSGKLYRQKDDAEAEVLAGFKEPALFAVADSGRHGLVVAASPGGNLYKVDDKGTTSSLTTLPAQMVWEVLPKGDDLMVATGTPATVMVVDRDAKATERARFEKAQNVLDIATLPDSDDLVVATQGPGLVARVRPDGKVSVLADPQQEEVRRVAVGPEGSVYAAVNGVRSPGEKFLGVPDPARAAAAAGNNKPRPESFVIRIHPSGFAEEWWTSPESPIHDISVRPDGSLLVAAGMKGAVLTVSADRETLRHGVADEAMITRLAPGKDGAVLALSGGEASLWRFHPEKAADGEFASKVFDAAGSARWVRVRTLSNPGGGGLRIAFREGNTAEPDATWSEWAGPVDLAPGDVTIPGGFSRFFQYKLFLDPAKDGGTPSVDQVRVFYTTPNQEPRLNEVKVEPQRPKEPAQAAQARGKYDVTWTAVDPNQDELQADVFLVPLAGGSPSLIAEEVLGGRHTIDSLVLPDGRYRVEVEVSDAPGNPAGTETTARRTSAIFLVDNNAPVITPQKIERQGDSVSVRFTTLDSTSLVTSADWRTGTKRARSLNPDDEAFDSSAEAFSLTLTGEDAKPGNLIIISVGDENGNRSFRELIVP